MSSLSIAFAHHIYAIPMYPFSSSIYPTVLCLFYHHMWNGAILIIGSAAHASIFIIGTQTISYNSHLINHRDVIIGHLIWVTIAVGLHSFSVYLHNDILQGFWRPEDMFHDNSIQLKPVLLIWM